MQCLELTEVRRLLDRIKVLDAEIDRCRKRIWDIEMPAYSEGKELSGLEMHERDNLLFKLEAIVEQRDELMEQLVKELNKALKGGRYDSRD